MQKLGKRRKNDIAQRMRQLARLKIAMSLNKTSAKDQQLINYLTPKSFDNCLNAVSAIAGLHQNQEDINIFRVHHHLCSSHRSPFAQMCRD